MKQEEVTSWDVIILSFKTLYRRLQFWIQPNILSVLFSLLILSGPAAKAGLYRTVADGLRDPAGVRVRVLASMQKGIRENFLRALLLCAIKWLTFFLIAFSIFFWVRQETWLLRVVSIVGFYGLVLWWLATAYSYPILVENPSLGIWKVMRRSLTLAFRRPIDSFLFAVIRTLLLILGLILLGPIMLIIPAVRAILALHAYWFITDEEIPGFVDPVEYAQKHL
jgi:uncharacterized membrane protein YesL